jgi:MFS family permease
MNIDFAGGWSNAWYAVVDTLPRILVFIAILVIGWIVAKVLAKLANAVLERVGFDRAVERGGVKQALQNSKYDASDIVSKIVFYAIILMTLTTAFSVFGPNPISDLLQAIIAWLPQLLVAIVIVVVASAIATAVRDLIGGSLSGLSYGRWLANLAWVFILGLGIIAALNQVGIATTVTTPVLIAVLATIAGTVIVGVGGGLIQPMRARWDTLLTRAEQETKSFSDEAKLSNGSPRPVRQLSTPGTRMP